MTGSKFEIFWGRILPDPPTRLVPWAIAIMLPPPPPLPQSQKPSYGPAAWNPGSQQTP